MQSRWDKKDSPNTPNQDLEKNVPPGSAASTRLPAWTSAWGEHPPSGLAPSLKDLQAGHIVSQPGDPYEREAGQIADQVMRVAAPGSGGTPVSSSPPAISSQLASSISRAPSMIQRAEAEEGPTSADTTAENAPTAAESTPVSDMFTAEAASETMPSAETPTTALIVDDSAAQLGPGQMKKSDFLAQLREAVCTTTGEALKGTIWSAAGCPWVDHWFGYYANRDSQQVERAIRRYAPNTANVTSASDYIPIICARVRNAIAVWSTTGEITGVPDGISTSLPGSTSAEAAGEMPPPTSAESTSSLAGTVSFKGREGGAREASNPQAIQGQLRTGRSLDNGVRSQMESAFGVDFSHVRVHTDATAARLSNNLNARAFTVGEHVAFGPDEYQPGTLVGDALIAHELAHVVQQGGASFSEPMQKGSGEHNSLEEDADRSAVDAVVSLWSGAKGMMKDIAGKAMPQLKSGLNLQRCTRGQPEKDKTRTQTAPRITMKEFIGIVRRIEAANPGQNALEIEQLIARTKYHSTQWDYLLPSLSAESGPRVTAEKGITAEDVKLLSEKLIVTLPGGEEADPLHIVVGLVAQTEKQAPGAGGAGGWKGKLVQDLPPGVTQGDVATWLGDVGSAAAEWMTAFPLPHGDISKEPSRQDYMLEYAPKSDLLGDIDSIAMSSSSGAFVFNPNKPLSENLERFYFPYPPGKGKAGGNSRRFHIFCEVSGFALESDGVTLTGSAIKTIYKRVQAFADWYEKNNPHIKSFIITMSDYEPTTSAWADRANDWQWFADQFRDFLQSNLKAEGR